MLVNGHAEHPDILLLYLIKAQQLIKVHVSLLKWAVKVPDFWVSLDWIGFNVRYPW